MTTSDVSLSAALALTIDLRVSTYLWIFKAIEFFYKRNKKYIRLIVDAKVTLKTKVVVVMLINILLSSTIMLELSLRIPLIVVRNISFAIPIIQTSFT